MFVYDIPAGRSSTPQRHLFEEVIYVLEGRGSTQLELADGTKRSFEWGPRSFFAIPLNAKHRHFNASGTHRALLAVTTDMPLMMNVFHNEDFIFSNDFEFADRVGKEEYYSGEGDLFMVRQGNDLWVTNFVPDLDVLELKDWSDRGVEATTIMFALAESSMHAHISEIATGTYKKAHRHLISDVHVTCVAGSGYSLLWYEGDQDFVRVDWRNGVVFPPHINQFHQHFAMSKEPARYVGTGLGSVRYPVTMARRKEGLGIRGEKQGASLSVKLGGMQIEYEDQDPRIHQIWLDEVKKHGVTPRMRETIGAR